MNRPIRHRRTFWHGTSSALLPSILETGLDPAPDRRVFQSHRGTSWEIPSDRSLSGVYLANDPKVAWHHASAAVQRFGGRDVIIAVEADERDGLPDEDTLELRRFMDELLWDLKLSRDTDGYAAFRRAWARSRRYRERVLDAAEEIGHRWLFRAPADMRADRALLGDLILARVDRLLVYLTWNDALMGMLGQSLRSLPFPVPATGADIAAQEDRLLAVKDRVCMAYRHLSLARTERDKSHTFRLPFRVAAEGDTARMLAAIECNGSKLELAWGDLMDGEDLESVPFPSHHHRTKLLSASDAAPASPPSL